MMTSKRTPVSRRNPCPVCEGDHKCSRGDDGSVFCGRRSGPVVGFVFLGQCRGDPQFSIYRAEDNQALHNGHTRPRRPRLPRRSSVDWNAKAQVRAANLTPDVRRELADALGLPETVLCQLVGLGFDPSDSRGPCWTFPESDGVRIIGINRRYRDGQKKVMSRGSRGLTIPLGWRDRAGPVFLPEGASDVLTLTALGLAAIGRPSNLGGVDAIASLLGSLPSERTIVVVGEMDAKKDGHWPGLDGATKTAQRLTEKLGRTVYWILPPDGAKDIRKWVNARKPDSTCGDSWADLGKELLRLWEGKYQAAGVLPAAGYTPNLMTSAEFAAANFRLEWLIRKLLVRGQPIVLGGPRKSLKTSIVIDLVVSLGTGTPFLGYFDVPEVRRTALLSGESGPHTLQETARRVCDRKSRCLAHANVLWGFSLPQLANREHLLALRDKIREHAVDVLVIDPAYLCLIAGGGIGGPKAENVFEMGPLLLAIAHACLTVGCTPLLIHHTRKHTGYTPLELEDLAYAGVAEFARQWLLLSRRERYEPGTGQHRLWLNTGGSCGQGGLWSVDIDEGVIDEAFRGRTWNVSVYTATEAIQASKTKREREKAEKQRRADDVDDTAVMAALDHLDPHAKGAGVNQVQAESRLSDSRMQRATTRLLGAGTVIECGVVVEIGSGAKRNVKGIRRVR